MYSQGFDITVVVIEFTGSEHAADDFEPFIGKLAQGAGIAVAPLAAQVVEGLGPSAVGGRTVGEQMHDVSPVFVTSAANAYAATFSALILYRGNTGHAS